MSETTLVQLRLSEEMLARVEAMRGPLQAKSRTDAVSQAILLADHVVSAIEAGKVVNIHEKDGSFGTLTLTPKKPQGFAVSSASFEVGMRCLYQGCEAEGRVHLFPSTFGSNHGLGVTPSEGWLFFALGYPSAPNTGICREHQQGDLPDNGVVARVNKLGDELLFEVVDFKSVPFHTWGVVRFPMSTGVLTLTEDATGQASEALYKAGVEVASLFGFSVKGD